MNSSASLASDTTKDGELFLEQIFKRLAGVVGPDRTKTSRRRRRRNGHGSGSRILLDGRAERVEGAVVSSIFLGNALGYRSCALKLRRSVKVRTLFAAMELETATRASCLRIKASLQNGAAI